MLSDFMSLRAEPEAPVVVGPQQPNALAHWHQLPSAVFPEVNDTFPLLTYHHSTIDNVYPAAGRGVWKKRSFSDLCHFPVFSSLILADCKLNDGGQQVLREQGTSIWLC